MACRPGQTLKDLYEERVPLYEKYADYDEDRILADMLKICEEKRILERTI